MTAIIAPLTTHRQVEVLTPRDRLESWKEIAVFLNRSERTVRRWEEKEGLPVHRLAHDKRGSVYAFTWELERWRESRRQLLTEDPAGPHTPEVMVLAGRWRWIIALVALMFAASVASFWLLYRPGQPSVRAANPEAVRLTELAKFGANAGRVQIETSIKYIQEAIRLDPEYAPAWSGLAVAHFVQMWFGDVPAIEAAATAKKEANRAIALDPLNGAAWRTLGGISHFIDWDHAAAESQLRRAMELAPQDAATFSWFGDYLVDHRRFDEARTFYVRAQEISPRWLEPITFIGNLHYFRGHVDLAIADYRRVLASEPNYGLGNHFLGRAYLAKGESAKGLAQLRKSNELLGGIPMSEADLGYALGATGHTAEARAMLARLVHRRTERYYPAFVIAQIHLGLGDREAALDWLDRAVGDRHLGFYLPSVDPLFDSVRSHPRFRKVLQRINLDQTTR
jgi:tetratricopeptide (TPR) repeat protein